MTSRLAAVATLGLVLGLLAAAAGPAAAEDFVACLARLRGDALAGGVSAATFEAAAAGLAPNDVLHFQHDQPEFSIPVWDYMAGLVDQERVDDGRAMTAKHADLLARIEARFGVRAETLVAFWGVESDYGKTQGFRPVVQSLATLACLGDNRGAFRDQFVSALKILQRRDVSPDRFNGSWAGAFGQTQFMPSTFLRNGIDMDGDGRADIVDSVPDALASTANYLRQSGWTPGLPWGFEVLLPTGYAGPSGRKSPRPAGFWAARGLRRADGKPLGGGGASLLLPAGNKGPAFLVTRNFDAIFAYNAAETYALAVGLLSDRIAGGDAPATPWPTDDPGLSRVERREMQALLLARGYAIGEPDGVVGTKTRESIADFQQRRGLPRDGRASASLLQALRDNR